MVADGIYNEDFAKHCHWLESPLSLIAIATHVESIEKSLCVYKCGDDERSEYLSTNTTWFLSFHIHYYYPSIHSPKCGWLITNLQKQLRKPLDRNERHFLETFDGKCMIMRVTKLAIFMVVVCSKAQLQFPLPRQQFFVKTMPSELKIFSIVSTFVSTFVFPFHYFVLIYNTYFKIPGN